MRIEARVGDLVQKTGDGQAQVGYSVAGRSRGQGAQVSWFSLKTMVNEFPSLGLKTDNCGLVIWPTKLP
jgi:hypothetical protein